MGMLAGKRALIVGVATDRSIAWGIAQAMHAHGAELAFSYANDRFRERVEPLAATLGSKVLMPLDVTVDEQIDAAAARSRETGATSTSWCTPWRSRRARRSRAALPPTPAARPSALPTMSPATASPPSRAPPHR